MLPTTTTTPPTSTTAHTRDDVTLVPWLEDAVSIQLHLARNWLQSKSLVKEQHPESNPDREWAGIYEDNGSCLHIVRPDARGNLHVIEEHPLTLTDGETTIRASLSERNNHLVSLFRKGHFIALQEYTLRHTTYGPPLDKVVIVPKAASDLTIAQSPSYRALTPIVECDYVVSALQDLQITRTHLDRRCFLTTAEPPSDDTMAPPQRPEGRAKQSSPNTQMPFGTQVSPRSRTGAVEVRHIATRNMEPVLAGYTQRESLDARISESDSDPEPDDRRTMNRLLGLLPGSNIGAKNPKKRNQSATSASKPARDSRAKDESRSKDPPPSQTPAGRNGSSVNLATTQNSNEVLHESLIDQIPDGSLVISSNEDELDDSVPSWLHNCRPVSGSAQIHHRQREVLNYPESWQKPPVGFRNAGTSVPVEVLAALKLKLRSSGEYTTQQSLDQTPVTALDEQSEAPGHATTQDSDAVSWPSSPVPESPKLPQRPITNRAGLPPDSSFELSGSKPTKRNKPNTGLPPDSSLESSSKSTAEHIKSAPRSSPPEITAAQESDGDEMELDVPRGLDDEQMASTAQPSRPAKTTEIVQVKETPYGKGKITPIRSQSKRTADEPYNSSRSVVRCTYNDAQSPANRSSQPVGGDAGQSVPAARSATDVVMDDGASNSPYMHATALTRDISKAEDGQGRLVNTEQAPAAVPVPVPSPILISSGGEGPSDRQSPKPAPAQTQTHEPSIHHETAKNEFHRKRKLDHSPSKRNSREPKKREIKVSSLGPPSPVKDLKAMLREQKRASLKDFRDHRRGESVAEHPPQSTRVDTSFDTETRASSQNLALPGDSGSFTSALDPDTAVRETAGPNTSFLSMQTKMEDIGIDKDLYDYPSPPAYRGNHDDNHGTHPPSVLSDQQVSRRWSPNMDVVVSDGQMQRRFWDSPASTMRQSTAQDGVSEPMSVFQRFKAAYPGYVGDATHFFNLCKSMISLDKEDKMVPKWQWDDFLIRNKSDYQPIARQLLTDGEEVDPYHRFYKDYFRDTLHEKGILKNRKTLETALAELDGKHRPKRSAFSSFDASAHSTTSNKESIPKPLPSSSRNRDPSSAAQNSPISLNWDAVPTRQPLPVVDRNANPTRQSHLAADQNANPTRFSLPAADPTMDLAASPVPSSTRKRGKKKRRTLPSGFTPQMASTPTATPTVAPSISSPLARPDPKGKQPVRASLPNMPPASTLAERPRYSVQGNAFNRSSLPSTATTSSRPVPGADEAAAETTGDPFRDFVRGHDALASFTGSTQMHPKLDWPLNLHVRPSISQVLGNRTYDVLEWGDVL